MRAWFLLVLAAGLTADARPQVARVVRARRAAGSGLPPHGRRQPQSRPPEWQGGGQFRGGTTEAPRTMGATAPRATAGELLRPQLRPPLGLYVQQDEARRAQALQRQGEQRGRERNREGNRVHARGGGGAVRAAGVAPGLTGPTRPWRCAGDWRRRSRAWPCACSVCRARRRASGGRCAGSR